MKVAEVFEKEHRSVTRSIRELECSAEFKGHNFVPVEIIEKNAIGAPVKLSYYELTKDGFTFLCMGFISKKASQEIGTMGAWNLRCLVWDCISAV